MKVVVVGAGVVGITTAWFLAQDGCEVTVLERGEAVACMTSHANAGMLTPSMADPWNAPGILWHVLAWLGQEHAPFLLRLRVLPSISLWGLSFLVNSRPARFRRNMEKNLRLASYSLQVLRELREALGLQYDQRSNGTIKVFRSARAFEHGVVRNRLLTELGLDVRTLDPKQVVAVEPSLGPVQDKLAGGFYCPTDESGDACAFATALADKARTAGVQLRFDTPVQGFETAGDRVIAARTARGRHEADVFVVAAGCWSPRLLSTLGIALSVKPVKGYSITVPIGRWDAAPRMPVIDDALHVAVTPLGTRLRVAGTAELAGFNRDLTPERVRNLFDLLLTLYPSFAPHLERDNAAPWAGLRPVSPDGVPRIGRMKFENLFVNSGHGHLGWTMSAGSARLLADLVMARPAGIDPAPYGPDRRT